MAAPSKQRLQYASNDVALMLLLSLLKLVVCGLWQGDLTYHITIRVEPYDQKWVRVVLAGLASFSATC